MIDLATVGRPDGRNKTTATRHARYGESTHPRARLMHRAEHVTLYWPSPAPVLPRYLAWGPRLVAFWWCGSTTSRPRLWHRDQIPDDRTICAVCEARAVAAGQPLSLLPLHKVEHRWPRW